MESRFQVSTFEGQNDVDPFYLYLDLVKALGEGQVFLLDAAKDEGNPDCRMSLIGVQPVLEVAVKDGLIAVTCIPGLTDYVQVQLEQAGETFISEPAMVSESAISGKTLYFRPTNVMVFLETLRTSIRALLPREQFAPFSSGLLGYIGYDAVHYLERLPKTTFDDRALPDIRLQWHGAVIQIKEQRVQVFDSSGVLNHLLDAGLDSTSESLASKLEQVIASRITNLESAPELLIHALEAGTGESEAVVTEDVTVEEFTSNLLRAKAYIEAGDIFQVVLSKRMRLRKRMHHYTAYERLRTLNPSPYMFMAEYPDMRLFGASPEVQFRAVGGLAEMKPIAGTSKGRGKTPEEDQQLQMKLLADEKECAEHLMLVDLCRNDLGRVSEIGTVQPVQFMVVEPYSHLFHLVSTVTGTLRPDVNVFHALLCTFPAGTLSGAPKIRAMEIIDELESYRRGPYGGMIGMVDLDANANTAIVIRTVVEKSGQYFIQVGCGVVADSDPEQEWLECGHKAGAVMDVLTGKSHTMQSAANR